MYTDFLCMYVFKKSTPYRCHRCTLYIYIKQWMGPEKTIGALPRFGRVQHIVPNSISESIVVNTNTRYICIILTQRNQKQEASESGTILQITSTAAWQVDSCNTR